MINEHYDYYSIYEKTDYLFFSEGKNGKIPKMISFVQIEESKWNLAFGDLNKGRIDDSIVTDNQDISKVIGTVAKTVYDFFDENPDCTIQIIPVDERRKRLYNYIFQKRIKEIEPRYQIWGLIKGKKSIFSSLKYYDSFEINLKFEL